jgi:hydroxyacylglutathione hydrolase
VSGGISLFFALTILGSPENFVSLMTVGVPEISVTDLKAKQSSFKVIDVRRRDEWTGELGHIKGAALATLETDFETYLTKLPQDQSYAIICRSGARSARATELALAHGFKSVVNVKGGMIAWNAEGFEIER